MTAPVGLIDLEEEVEYEEIVGAPLTEITCERCGAVQVILPLTHAPGFWCGACRPPLVAFPDPDRDLYPVLAGPPAPLPTEVVSTTYAPEPKNKVEKVTKERPYPKPKVTSRDEPSGAEPVPGAVAAWAEKAADAGWRVKVQRSVGCLPHATHGTPTRVRTLHAVIITKNGASAYAVHDGEGWVSVVTWGTGAPWFAGAASITDFGQYIAADGQMPARWYAAIRARESGKVDKGKARAECNRGMHKGATLAAGRWTCPLCENSWGAKEAAWRKPKTTTKDTAR